MLSSLYDDDAQAVEAFLTESFDAASIQEFEAPLLRQGVPLMRYAASVVARTARRMLAHNDIPLSHSHIVVLAGAGNNGGDGVFAAASLGQSGARVTVIAVGPTLHQQALRELMNGDTDILALDEQSEIPGALAPDNSEEQRSHINAALEALHHADLIIDAMTGIGLHGSLRGIPAQIANAIGESHGIPSRLALPPAAHVAQSQMVLAVDTPSGVGVDDGTLPGSYIPADVTVSFGALKPCLTLPPAAYICGQIILVDFDFATDQKSPNTEVMTARKCAQSLRMPQLGDSKYTRSVLGLVTGSGSYPGAGLLSTVAAGRSNVGMVRYLGPEHIQDRILQSFPEAVFDDGRVQAWVVGSGVPATSSSDDSDLEQIRRIRELLKSYDADTDIGDSSLANGSGNVEPVPPVVVDAGALPLLPEHVIPSVIITPHAGEMARLLQSHGEDVSAAQVSAQPLHWATRAWELTGATVLLKGAITVVVGDEGTAEPRVLTVGRAPAWLSTAGAGDVLAGVLGSMLAQNSESIMQHPDLLADYVVAGAYLHALAASVACESVQLAWSLPIMADASDLESFEQEYDERLLTASVAEGPSLGHPIVAADVIQAIPEAYALLIGLYDDPVERPHEYVSAEEDRASQ
jgi:hydroxyethylthiazole kinase-like uncharacterized protein yjeF